MGIIKEMSTSGIHMSTMDNILSLAHQHYQGTGPAPTVKKAMSDVMKNSTHNPNGVKCTMCRKCKAWMISSRVICLMCLGGENSIISRLFKGCSETTCGANNTFYSKFIISIEDAGNLVLSCSHSKKTSVGPSYDYFSASEHVGNIVRMHQLDLLTNCTRTGILERIDYCKKNGVITFYLSMNALAYYRTMKEREMTEACEEYLQTVRRPDEQRNYMDLVEEQLKSALFDKLSPKKGT